VAKDSDVEMFCALLLFIDSWRWEGMPWYLRSGKYLAKTATEVLVELKSPPHERPGQLLAFSALPQLGRRPRRSSQALWEGVRRGPARTLLARRTARR
jgi:hypothetical protein